MKIYRWLNDKGNGLYQDKFAERVGLVFAGGDLPYYQPPVYEDVRGIPFEDLKYHSCAFRSYKQMMAWFRDIDPLDIFIEGGSLVELDVDREFVYDGTCQCTYVKTEVRGSRGVSLDEFIVNADEEEKRMREFWWN